MKEPLNISKLTPRTRLYLPHFAPFGNDFGFRSPLISIEKEDCAVSFQDLTGWQGFLLGVSDQQRHKVPKKASYKEMSLLKLKNKSACGTGVNFAEGNRLFGQVCVICSYCYFWATAIG